MIQSKDKYRKERENSFTIITQNERSTNHYFNLIKSNALTNDSRISKSRGEDMNKKKDDKMRAKFKSIFIEKLSSQLRKDYKGCKILEKAFLSNSSRMKEKNGQKENAANIPIQPKLIRYSSNTLSNKESNSISQHRNSFSRNEIVPLPKRQCMKEAKEEVISM